MPDNEHTHSLISFFHSEDVEDDGEEEMDKESDVEAVKEVGKPALACHTDTMQKKIYHFLYLLSLLQY